MHIIDVPVAIALYTNADIRKTNNNSIHFNNIILLYQSNHFYQTRVNDTCYMPTLTNNFTIFI